ncbi:hypothetical protein MBAV_005170 [Candidatus Magnetobacterium bavaricum]|uniref:Uncharacterized protein n=1 Tax=Candidatus Magnetobacterium bavaricum TaxID=29290 RepID=A0A0F3GL69_9BACT|nr:hypothetical protein MBAV_005170 [Candidatus Magnetobacterium bavaricum]
MAEFIITLKKLCSSGSELVLVFDKGNNKKEIFNELTGKISWIGSLVPSNYGELIEVDVKEYHGCLPYIHG